MHGPLRGCGLGIPGVSPGCGPEQASGAGGWEGHTHRLGARSLSSLRSAPSWPVESPEWVTTSLNRVRIEKSNFALRKVSYCAVRLLVVSVCRCVLCPHQKLCAMGHGQEGFKLLF